jgi:hypothetical protein
MAFSTGRSQHVAALQFWMSELMLLLLLLLLLLFVLLLALLLLFLCLSGH